MKNPFLCFSAQYVVKKISLTTLSLILLTLFTSTASMASETYYPEVVFILDGSGSMWGKSGSLTKIEIARNVMLQIVPSLPAEVKTGLVAYGHRRKGDCADIELLVESGMDRSGIQSKINKINPKGMTPIAASIELVTETLKTKETETTVILVSDGKETCHDDPCGVVKALKESGIKFILHVVGFGVDPEADKQLQCLAREGGGRYFSATDASSLLSALENVKKEVAQKVERAKTSLKKSVSKLGKIEIKIPASSTISINTFKIVRKKDGKIVKTVKDPSKLSTHPLLTGDYELIAGFANSNYKPDSEVSFGDFTIKGGETFKIGLGSMIINIADSLENVPAGAVIITSESNDNFKLILPYTGNSYYFFKPKPLPEGIYNFGVHYRKGSLYRSPETPVWLAKNIKIKPGEESTITIDSGILIKEIKSSSIESWELVKSGGNDIIIRINSASNGNYPLWKPYAVPPGTYDLFLYMEGMDEPLPAGESIGINKGELLEFDTGI